MEGASIMNAFRFTVKAIGFLVFLTWIPAATLAATFVSFTGTDAGGCTGNSPCRTINYALSQTSSGGVVVILDSGSYAPFTVDKAVQIVAAPGAHAQISVNGTGSGVVITTTDLVVLKRLAIKGGSTSTNGIGANLSTGNIVIEDCSISGFRRGIYYEAFKGNLSVKDTNTRDCGTGIEVTGTNPVIIGGDANFAPSEFVRVLVEHCQLESNNFGLNALNAVWVTVRNSVAANNKRGIRASVTGEIITAAVMTIENCLVANNETGIYGNAVTGGATIYISNSTISSNDKGLVADQGSQIFTRQNNTIVANAVGTVGNIATFTAS